MCLGSTWYLVVGWSFICWWAADVRAEEHPVVGVLRETAGKTMAELETDEVFKEAELAKKYLAALDLLEKKLAAEGDLDGIVGLREEKKAVAENGTASGHSGTALVGLRGKYLQLREDLRRETDKERAKLLAGVKQAVTGKESELVKAGDVDGALEIRRDGERLLGELSKDMAGSGTGAGMAASPGSVSLPEIRTAEDLRAFLAGSVWKVTGGSGSIRSRIEFGMDGNATADDGRKLGGWSCDDARTFRISAAGNTGVFGPGWDSFELSLADGGKVSATKVTNPHHGRTVRLRLADDAKTGLSFSKGRPARTSQEADTVRMVCGLSDPDHVSFEYPPGRGSYLRHIKYVLNCHERPDQMTPLFREDATFKVVPLDDGAVRLEAVNFPGFFLAVDAGKGQVVLRKDPGLPVSRFRLEPGG
ncbi:AbfB domain-containing protein [Luteolibacter sp. SL250]|uniref:AbfB domain-containing protein n=1 Tax=Luteolibacter sp. SL250 TaxID=2995170 RepID=UPI00227119DF|nr:AbfB domain-containing protein [Luteolibacter sp. SL250]WAC21286.1 AbfB domain-containing protein [Luteolibacter sp. SL250]